jgi:hypothetical protein
MERSILGRGSIPTVSAQWNAPFSVVDRFPLFQRWESGVLRMAALVTAIAYHAQVCGLRGIMTYRLP